MQAIFEETSKIAKPEKIKDEKDGQIKEVLNSINKSHENMVLF